MGRLHPRLGRPGAQHSPAVDLRHQARDRVPSLRVPRDLARDPDGHRGLHRAVARAARVDRQPRPIGRVTHAWPSHAHQSHHDVHARFVLRRARRCVLCAPLVVGHAREFRCQPRALRLLDDDPRWHGIDVGCVGRQLVLRLRQRQDHQRQDIDRRPRTARVPADHLRHHPHPRDDRSARRHHRSRQQDPPSDPTRHEADHAQLAGVAAGSQPFAGAIFRRRRRRGPPRCRPARAE